MNKRVKTFNQFINESISTEEIQNLIDTLRSEADSNKMRIAGTSDKLEWAMKFVVLMAFVNQLQDDLANGRTGNENYAEDLYKNIEGRATQLKQDAINSLKQNGLNPEAADKLNVTPPENETNYDDSRDEFVDPNGNSGSNSPTKLEPTHEAKNWSLVQVKPGTLHVETVSKRQTKPKSPAEKEFRTAFNHARNEARKILNPKPIEPNVPGSSHNTNTSFPVKSQPPIPPNG